MADVRTGFTRAFDAGRHAAPLLQGKGKDAMDLIEPIVHMSKAAP
jgi:hypothetical protein